MNLYHAEPIDFYEVLQPLLGKPKSHISHLCMERQLLLRYLFSRRLA